MNNKKEDYLYDEDFEIYDKVKSCRKVRKTKSYSNGSNSISIHQYREMLYNFNDEFNHLELIEEETPQVHKYESLNLSQLNKIFKYLSKFENSKPHKLIAYIMHNHERIFTYYERGDIDNIRKHLSVKNPNTSYFHTKKDLINTMQIFYKINLLKNNFVFKWINTLLKYHDTSNYFHLKLFGSDYHTEIVNISDLEQSCHNFKDDEYRNKISYTKYLTDRYQEKLISTKEDFIDFIQEREIVLPLIYLCNKYYKNDKEECLLTSLLIKSLDKIDSQYDKYLKWYIRMFSDYFEKRFHNFIDTKMKHDFVYILPYKNLNSYHDYYEYFIHILMVMFNTKQNLSNELLNKYLSIFITNNQIEEDLANKTIDKSNYEIDCSAINEGNQLESKSEISNPRKAKPVTFQVNEDKNLISQNPSKEKTNNNNSIILDKLFPISNRKKPPKKNPAVDFQEAKLNQLPNATKEAEEEASQNSLKKERNQEPNLIYTLNKVDKKLYPPCLRDDLKQYDYIYLNLVFKKASEISQLGLKDKDEKFHFLKRKRKYVAHLSKYENKLIDRIKTKQDLFKVKQDDQE